MEYCYFAFSRTSRYPAMAKISTAIFQITCFFSDTAEDFKKYFQNRKLKNTKKIAFVEVVGNRIHVMQVERKVRVKCRSQPSNRKEIF